MLSWGSATAKAARARMATKYFMMAVGVSGVKILLTSYHQNGAAFIPAFLVAVARPVKCRCLAERDAKKIVAGNPEDF